METTARPPAAPLATLSASERTQLKELLWYDLLTEFDARFLSAYLRTLSIPLSDAFWCVEERWAEDEERHFDGLKESFTHLFGWTEAEEQGLATRTADFEPIAHLFQDEFAITCLGAYDEQATVRGYRANLHRYDRMGEDFARFIRDVIADEGRHYNAFLRLIRQEHAHRKADAPEVIARVRAAEGSPYLSTFVLDHDDPVYGDEIFDAAAGVLLRHLGSRR